MQVRGRAAALCVAAACAGLLAACGDEPSTATPEEAGGRGTLAPVTPTGSAAVKWSISPISATFDQGCYCTTYDVVITTLHEQYDTWRVTWTLTLVVVPGDSGLGDPGTPGSMAAVDGGCTNAGKGVTTPVVDSTRLRANATRNSSSGDDSFTWTHPDPHVIEPYACNHASQGPHGHEGIIKVVVAHGAQTCTVAYYGTHTGMSTDTQPAGHEQPGPPTCTAT